MQLLNSIKGFLVCFLLFIGYITIASIVGEEHPFSQFQMYSQLPPNADYYYLVDEHNAPIAGAAKFKFSVNQIKDAMVAGIERDHLPNRNIATTQYIAGDVLQYVISRNMNNPQLKQYRQIKLVKCDIKMQNGIIHKTDSVLSIWNSKAAY